MKTNSCVAFWAALLSSTVWAASANPYSTVIAVVWGAFAVLILAIETAAAWEEKKRSNINSAALDEYNKVKPGAAEDSEAWAKMRKARV